MHSIFVCKKEGSMKEKFLNIIPFATSLVLQGLGVVTMIYVPFIDAVVYSDPSMAGWAWLRPIILFLLKRMMLANLTLHAICGASGPHIRFNGLPYVLILGQVVQVCQVASSRSWYSYM